MIKLEHLTKSFGPVKAVDDLSLEIREGDIIGFLGPNGAGKTTTLRLITGFLSPDMGNVTIDGIPVQERAFEAQKLIGYLPENNPLYKDMLVSEFLGLSADLKGIPREKRKAAFDFATKAVAIGDVFYRPIGELSKGYRQRVGMAAALLHQPRILIMDEPTEGLDPNQRTEIRALIKDLAKDRTIIMSTHVMQEAQAVCNRLIIINKGKLVADGTSEELSRAAKNERVLLLEVEGEGVESVLRALPGLEHVDIEVVKDSHIRAKLFTNESVDLRPEISKRASENRWIIWQLAEQEQKLEDTFHKLTSTL